LLRFYNSNFGLNKIKPPYNKRTLERLENKDKIKSEIESIIEQREELLQVLLDIKFVQKYILQKLILS
jgi:histidinol-phosphate aminotransferase